MTYSFHQSEPCVRPLALDSTHWSSGYIAVLEREGITLGDNGNFHPSEPVTRAQFVAFLYRIIQK
ncbi:S-layer homology domain-containing protein [Lysinibacillus fusiformis]|uniref:S-layer homology domain-containing protein n=1 Tax=Lysinibacillus fusiformis TaxID=28031 RepID=UPI00359C2F9E